MNFDDARCCRNSNLEMVRLYDVYDVAWPMGDDIAAGATPQAAMDMFVVPTISFRLLYGLLIMGHGRRQIVWLGVTAHPTSVV